jgi:hypothetical protein
MNTERLLEELCVKLGFCLEADDKRALIDSPPATVDAFTDEVIRREGLDRVTYDSTIRRQVEEVIARHMGQPLRRTRRHRAR